MRPGFWLLKLLIYSKAKYHLHGSKVLKIVILRRSRNLVTESLASSSPPPTPLPPLMPLSLPPHPVYKFARLLRWHMEKTSNL
jgi:hypothetical protein